MVINLEINNMELSPEKIYKDYKHNNLHKSYAADLLIALINHIDDDTIRTKCIKILKEIDCKNENVFDILENLFISDPNEEIRNLSATFIKNSFLDKALAPMNHALKYETSYSCLMTIIETLEQLNTNSAKINLIDNIKKIDHEKFRNSIISILNENNIINYSCKELANILRNFYTILFLERKFNNLDYKLVEGLVVDLDFSNVNNQDVGWRYRESIQDLSEIIGIKNLNKIKNLETFPINWATQNEYSCECLINLILTIVNEKDESITQKILISQLKKIKDEDFNNGLKNLLKKIKYFEDLPISKLADLYVNYIIITFLKKKFPHIKYEINNGEITKLKISNRQLIKFPEFICFLRSLKKISLKNCSLYSLPESIRNLKSIEKLNLEGNSLQMIPYSIKYLKSLKFLNLKRNQLKRIPNSIGFLEKLEYLNLEKNNLVNLPKSIGLLSSLKYLNLNSNYLKNIPDTICNIQSLTYLNLYLNKIKSLPDSIGRIVDLEYLNVANNDLTELPDSMTNLLNIKKIILADNRISSLPVFTKKLKNLETLDLRWNKIQKISDSIAKLNQLRTLNLTHNKLNTLPDSIGSLINLETLDLTWNNIKLLPDSLGKMNSLKFLILYGNKLEILPSSIGLLQNLEYLNLWGNKLTDLPNTIGSLQNLKELCLNGNKLENLPESLGKCKSLNKLMLNNNNLTNIPTSIMNIPNLEEITFKWNNMKYFSD